MLKMLILKGFSYLRYIQVLWAMEIAETHVGRAHSAAFDHCSADLQVRKTTLKMFTSGGKIPYAYE